MRMGWRLWQWHSFQRSCCWDQTVLKFGPEPGPVKFCQAKAEVGTSVHVFRPIVQDVYYIYYIYSIQMNSDGRSMLLTMMVMACRVMSWRWSRNGSNGWTHSDGTERGMEFQLQKSPWKSYCMQPLSFLILERGLLFCSTLVKRRVPRFRFLMSSFWTPEWIDSGNFPQHHPDRVVITFFRVYTRIKTYCRWL